MSTGAVSSSSRTGGASPAGSRSPSRSGQSAQWQRAHCVKNVKQLRARARRPGRRAVLRRPGATSRARDDVDAPAAADAEHDGVRTAPSRRTRSTPIPSATTCCRCSPTDASTGRPTRTPAATRCTSTTCGRWRDSPTATPPRSSPSCCPPARSTAATAPAWIWSATSTPAGRQAQLPGQAGRPPRLHARLPEAQSAGSRRRRDAAATWPTCRGARLEDVPRPVARHREHPRRAARH